VTESDTPDVVGGIVNNDQGGSSSSSSSSSVIVTGKSIPFIKGPSLTALD
jgi:hypothetical protein